MIAGLSSSGALQSLYPQYNKKKVTKVKKVHSGSSSAQEISSKDSAAEDDTEDTITANMQAALAEETKDLDSITYTDGNPYVSAKKSIDESLLLGMNIDEKA